MTHPVTPAKPTPDTYWLLEGVSLLVLSVLGGLYVMGEENVPPLGPVLMVSNHVSYLDPVAIGDASPRRVVFMAKAELFKVKPLGFLLRGVDAFPVKRGEADRAAFKNTLAMIGEDRVICIFPEGTRSQSGEIGSAEGGAGVFATRTGCPVVPVYVHNSNRMLDDRGRLHRRSPITVTFGLPFILPQTMGREDAGHELMTAIRRTKEAYEQSPVVYRRRIWPHWFQKTPEGSRARRRG
ncbi:MAG: 1-acyl-sn-glycerol-3-phosphate acyltransferase [Cytophagales bacterium]|nr:1-acyl-sn-glycerol-3-phosphate acyltransferase [Armatimonadota bacterium]